MQYLVYPDCLLMTPAFMHPLEMPNN